MSETIGTGCSSAGELVSLLQSKNFPLTELAAHPVSAIENMAAATARGAVERPVCGVQCLACCTNSIGPAKVSGTVHVLTPALLRRILEFARELDVQGIPLFSTERLNLFSGTNEPDHPQCLELRTLLSEFLELTRGIPLGATSSDIAFHISSAPAFRGNIESLMRSSRLWDNICFSIDEQIPFRSESDYDAYLETLAWTWQVLRPALQCKLDHARSSESLPRVILNMLLPPPQSGFRDKHRFLYPGGPERALSFEELTGRYILPFAGALSETGRPVPSSHRFTTGTGTLSGIPRSSVYVAKGNYAITGRGGSLVKAFRNSQASEPAAVRTKILPAGEGQFRIKACLTTTPSSEDELIVPATEQPAWFAINRHIIDVAGFPI